jgi:tetratricopeptide (TPR) repeat protein
MSSKRPAILMAILLLLIGAYLMWPILRDLYLEKTAEQAQAVARGPLPAANGISNLAMKQEADGRWIVSFDYAYTGEPKGGFVRVFHLVSSPMNPKPINWHVGTKGAVPGTHHFTAEVVNPSARDMYTTEKVLAEIFVPQQPPVAKASLDQRIQWPDPLKTEVAQALATGKADSIVQKAVAMIDTSDAYQLQMARRLLQTLVDQSPGTDAAYVELARVAMKTSWNASGLRDAEKLIGSALQIRPDSVNAKILLGYVYAHQGRHKPAEALFAEAAVANPPNLWLWANWGEVLAMQGQIDAAVQKYREAIVRPPAQGTYDRARWDAYQSLLALLQRRDDIAGIGTLLKQRAQEYPGSGCFSVDYARHLVLQRGEALEAQAVLRESPSRDCDESRKRLVEGLVRYVAWAAGGEPERAELLRQARAFYSVNPYLFYTLASSDKAAVVAKQLIAAGEKLGMQDEEQMDALAYALRNADISGARRLLRLGASPMAEIGPQKMPVALIPVINRDAEGIRLMQRSGVDFAKLRYQGTTATDYARKEGDAKLLQLLDPKAGKV